MRFVRGDVLRVVVLAACILSSASEAAAQGGPAPWLSVEMGNGLAAAPCSFPCEQEGDIGVTMGVGAGVGSGRLRAGGHLAWWTPVFRTPPSSLSSATLRTGAASADGAWTVDAGAGGYRFRSGARTRAQGPVAEVMVSRALGRWRGAQSRLSAGYLHGLGGRIALPDDAPSPGNVPFRPRIVSVGIALAWGAGTR